MKNACPRVRRDRVEADLRRLGPVIVAATAFLAGSPAAAEEAALPEPAPAAPGDASSPTAAVVRPAQTDDAPQALASAVTRLVRARLDTLGVVRLSESPAATLEDIQLTIGCIGETVECLGQVAGQLGAELLVLPAIERIDREVVVTVGLFDTRDDSLHSVARRAPEGRSEAILDEIEPMIDELFGVAPAAGQPGAAPAEPPERSLRWLLAPLITLGAGAAVLVAGGVVGGLAEAAEDDYAAAPTTTTQEVDAALELGDSAERRALAANVLFGLGAAIVVAGGALALVLGLRQRRSAASSTARPAAAFSFGVMGLSLALGHAGGAP